MVTPSHEITMEAMEIGTMVTPIYAQGAGRYDIPRKWSVKTDIAHPCCGFLEVKHLSMEHAEFDHLVSHTENNNCLYLLSHVKYVDVIAKD